MVQNPDKIPVFKQLEPGLTARKDHIFTMMGKAQVEWVFSVNSVKNQYIDSVKIYIPDQAIKVLCETEEIHPDTGESLDLKGQIFDVNLENVEIDTTQIKLNSILEPKEIIVFEDSAQCSFEGEGSR